MDQVLTGANADIQAKIHEQGADVPLPDSDDPYIYRTANAEFYAHSIIRGKKLYWRHLVWAIEGLRHNLYNAGIYQTAKWNVLDTDLVGLQGTGELAVIVAESV